VRLARKSGWLALVVGACLLEGCASHSSPTLANRLIKPGEPSIEYGDPSITSQAPKRASRPSKPVPASKSPVRSTAGTTIEGTDQQLSAALLIEAAAPSVNSHLLVAREYLRLRIFDAAEKRIEQAVRLDPSRSEPHEMLARLWRDWGSPELALGPAYRAVATAPRAAGPVNTLGTVLGALGAWPEAVDRFKEAALREPGAAWAYSNWCYAEFRLGHLDTARQQCERALTLDEGWRAAHNNLGLVLAADGDMDGARAQFLAAGDTATAEYNTGIVNAAVSDYQSAAEAFERAIGADPDFTAAKARAHQARVNAMEKQKQAAR
jgi:Tfp pilus assembly protein PilF